MADGSNSVQVSDTTMLNIVEKAAYQISTHTTPSNASIQNPQLVQINELLLIMWCNLILRA
jgi:hypothetical protein